ncbi:MAG: extracellular solute-binding protein [Patescibacteria group bacterium]|nr:extracellular solute-binding protein [Patescibacteria group bacterium]
MTSLAALLVFTGISCGGDDELAELTKPFTIQYWRVFDDRDAFRGIMESYRALHPHISIEYRQFRFDEYEREVLNAIAEDRGPDIFSIHNTWMNEWQPRLLAAPATLSIPFTELKGSLKKEKVTTIRSMPGITVRGLANDFIDAVSYDVVIPTEQADPRAPLIPRIYGLPLSVDTMVLLYNRDILNSNGIAKPASHWLEFQEHVKKITRLDEAGNVIQPATSLGTAENVDRASDILSVLMMQNGAQMADGNGIATFDRIPTELTGRPTPPGAEALIFYTDFANPEKEVYTWNDKMPDSLEAFIKGQTAYFFGYSYHLSYIRNSNSELNFGIAPLPQIQGNQPKHYANYWVEVVSDKTEHPDELWEFLQFMTAAEQAQKYLDKTGKPTALRSLINSQLEDIDLSVFASQLPTALTWYRGTDATATEDTFKDMIGQMLVGEDPDPVKIVELGATKVNQTIE